MPYQYAEHQYNRRPPHHQNNAPPSVQPQYVQHQNYAAYYGQPPPQQIYQQPTATAPAPQIQVVVPPASHFQYPSYPQYAPSQQPYYQQQQACHSNQIQQQYPPQPYDQAFQQPPMPPPMSGPSAPTVSVPAPRVLQDVQPNRSRPQQPVVVVPKPTEQESNSEHEEELNYAEVLLTCADEYIENSAKVPYQSEQYYKLIATALGCMESTLNNFKLTPLREVQLTLQYVQILYDETENYDDAERLLSKGIGTCEQHNFYDLKYSMQLLLAKVLYLSRPKAALKDLESNIEELEVRKHTAWEYCMRFQYTSLVLTTSSHADIHSAINQFERISAAARRNADHAILAYSSACEALVHLSSTNKDAVTSAQRALAVARGLQLNPDVTQCPQLIILLELIDLCCSIKVTDNSDTEKKRKLMQTELYKAIDGATKWDKDGLLTLPLNRRSTGDAKLQQGGLVAGTQEKPQLAFSWLPKEEVEALAYLLSAISVAHKNGNDGGKAEKFIAGGLDICYELQEKQKPGRSANSERRLALLECHFLLERSFLYSAKGEWEAARNTTDLIEKAFDKLGKEIPADFQHVYQYVRGAIFQGCGELGAAFKIFQELMKQLMSSGKTHAQSSETNSSQSRSSQSQEDIITDLSLLAAMNTILIVNNPSHSHHDWQPAILGRIQDPVKTTTNKAIKAAYELVLSVNHGNNILTTKQYLGNALTTAQNIGNAQIMALTLIMMQEKIFKGIQSEQAMKCAKAAKQQARRAGDPSWVAVATQLEAECLEVHNLHAQAEEKSAEAQEAMAKLPEKVRQGQR